MPGAAEHITYIAQRDSACKSLVSRLTIELYFKNFTYLEDFLNVLLSGLVGVRVWVAERGIVQFEYMCYKPDLCCSLRSSGNLVRYGEGRER